MGELSGFVSLFLDILGWGARLLEFDQVPGFAVDEARVSRVIGEPIRQRRIADTSIRKWLETATGGWKHDDPRLEQLTPEKRDLLRRMTNQDIMYQSFSDCFVLTSEFGSPPEVGLAAVENLLVQVCALMPILLSAEVPMRGAIEIGWGTRVDDGVVGSSLVKAFKLESTVADYPRVVVGDELLQVVSHFLGPDASDLQRGVAGRIDQLVRREDDGTHSLDYLGEYALGFHEWNPAADKMDVLRDAFSFVRESRRTAIDAGVEKHARRWSTVREYFLRCLGRDRLL